MTNRHTKPEDLFRAEKQRSLTTRDSQHARLLAEAKAAFDKLMAEGQAARKSGRPRKHPLPPLKTSSSRAPMKPPVLEPATKPAELPAKAAVAKPAKVAERSTAKRAASEKKSPRSARSARGTGRAAAKPKPKTKRSARR